LNQLELDFCFALTPPDGLRLLTNEASEDRSPYQAPRTPLVDPPSGRRKSPLNRKTKCLIFVLVWSAVAAFVVPFIVISAPDKPALHSLVAITVSAVAMLVCLQWIRYDAEDREFQLWEYFFVFTIFSCGLGLIQIPIYFLRSRGLLHGLLMTLLSAVFVALIYCVMFAASEASIAVIRALDWV